jgi:septal ring factor EnvC (AmiA/AmiB activator)
MGFVDGINKIVFGEDEPPRKQAQQKQQEKGGRWANNEAWIYIKMCADELRVPLREDDLNLEEVAQMLNAFNDILKQAQMRKQNAESMAKELERENTELTRKLKATSNSYNAIEMRLNEANEKIRQGTNQQTQDPEYIRWKAAQKEGRKRKKINWKKYDILKAEGLNERETAACLHVSTATLRKRVRERAAGNAV